MDLVVKHIRAFVVTNSLLYIAVKYTNCYNED